MDVAFLREGPAQALVAGEVRHDAKLDLRIVRGEQYVPLGSDESLAYAPAFRGADRYVLEIGIAG